MVKFTLEKKTLLGRLGLIETWNSIEVSHQTPSCLTYLRAGHIPHLTWEVAENQLKLSQSHQIYQMTLPSLVNQAKIIEKFGKGVAKFCGLPEHSAVHLTPFDPLGKMPGGYNDTKSVAIWTPNGKVSVDVKMWKGIIMAFGCESYETLVDYDTPRDTTQKKLVKAVDRTKTFLEQLVMQDVDTKIPGSRIVSLGGGFSKYHRRKCAVDVGLEENTAGYTVEFHEFIEGKETDEKEIAELLDETFSPLPPTKLRMISGPFNPSTVLFLVKQGIDLFDSSFPIKLAEEGHAFCLADDFPTSSKYEVVDFNNQKFADDFTPIFDGCACYSCTKYTKGYLQHLLNTRELLASILLVIHNMSEYDRMFMLIRKSLENSEGI